MPPRGPGGGFGPGPGPAEERFDGFEPGRRAKADMTAEIRLPEAINRKLLCPFQYFGVSDSVNLDSLTWSRGGYAYFDPAFDRAHRVQVLIQLLPVERPELPANHLRVVQHEGVLGGEPPLALERRVRDADAHGSRHR